MPRFPLLLSLLVLLATPVLAQTDGVAPPVPDAKPPAMVPLDDSLEPQVTIKKSEGKKIEEYRINGQLYKIVVTPDGGIPYTLIDPRGDGSFVPVEGPGTPGLAVPMWVIGTF